MIHDANVVFHKEGRVGRRKVLELSERKAALGELSPVRVFH
jgi:hypothetical protein